MIKNRNNYDFIDFIWTNENRNKTRAFIDILLFAQSRFGFSQKHQIIQDGKMKIVYDDNLEIIYPVS